MSSTKEKAALIEMLFLKMGAQKFNQLVEGYLSKEELRTLSRMEKTAGMMDSVSSATQGMDWKSPLGTFLTQLIANRSMQQHDPATGAAEGIAGIRPSLVSAGAAPLAHGALDNDPSIKSMIASSLGAGLGTEAITSLLGMPGPGALVDPGVLRSILQAAGATGGTLLAKNLAGEDDNARSFNR